MHKLRQTNPARQRIHKIPLPTTAAKSKLNATANAENSVAPTNAPNAASQDHKGETNMGSVIVTYKVFPEDIVENFDALKRENKNSPARVLHQLKDTAKNQ